MSDIKFSTANEVVVDAFTLKVTGADLKMDHSPRRKNASTHRRAMVHDFDDGITLNWAEDYPGGITLKGNVKVSVVSSPGNQLHIRHYDVLIDNHARRGPNNPRGQRRAFVHDFNDGLTVNWNKDYPGGVTINGEVKCPDNLLVGGNNILNLINTMSAKITSLEARIAVLESKIP